jgi:hypothetical protein
VKLDFEVLRPAAIAAKPARLGADRLLSGSLHALIMATALFLAPAGCSPGGDEGPKSAVGRHSR